MENKHFISFSLQDINPDNMPEEVLMSHIRVIAHQLDKDLQYAQSNQEKKFNKTKLLTQELRLKSANKRFSSQKPDLIWANYVQESYCKALNGQQDDLFVSHSKELLDMSEDAFTKLIQTRRSIRFYNDSPIDDALLEKIVSFGLWAPSNCNVQALQYIMVKDPLIREKLEINSFKKEMGYCTLAIICDYRFYPDGDIDSPLHDSGAAIQNILLACHFFDVGACYISDKGTNTLKIREALGISNDAQKISALIWMGRYEKTPTAPARRNLSEVYSVL